jgi:hypothetical protein
MKKRENLYRGSLAVEFVMGVMIWAILIAALVFFSQYILLKKHAQSAARFGTLLQSCGLVGPDTVQIEMVEFLNAVSHNPDWTWVWDVGRFTETEAARFYQLVMTRVSGRYVGASHSWHPSVAMKIEEMVVAQEVMR